MSLKKNIFANYITQIYIALIGIVMVPVYIKFMGAETYGLIGFFAVMQAWFALLDAGLSPTITRETARFQAGATDALNFRRMVRALEGVFFIVALVGGTLLFLLSDFIARDWLKASTLPLGELVLSVQLMAIIIALRWICGLYRGVINGAEKLVWLCGFNSGIATLRFVLVVPLMVFVGTTPAVFFSFQLAAALIEIVILTVYAYRLLPNVAVGNMSPLDWASLKPMLKFSLSIAFTSSVWVMVTQTDKLILSKLLPLVDYGYFTLAVLLASGITMISGPISSAIMPRMARLEAQGDHVGLIVLYRNATQFVVVCTGAVTLTFAFCAESLLTVWTGDHSVARQAAPTLILYALGNGVLVISAFPYYLQYAKGNLRLHMIGNAVFVVLFVPTIIWATTTFGSIGAGAVWLGMNLVSFIAWLPLVHRKFEKGLNKKWYFHDVLAIQVPMLFLALIINGWTNSDLGRPVQIFWLTLICGGLTFTGLLFSSAARDVIRRKGVKYFNG